MTYYLIAEDIGNVDYVSSDNKEEFERLASEWINDNAYVDFMIIEGRYVNWEVKQIIELQN